MILAEHKMISQAIGFSIGIHAKGDQSIERKNTYTDEIQQGPTAQMVNTNYKDVIFSFLRVSSCFSHLIYIFKSKNFECVFNYIYSQRTIIYYYFWEE